MTSSSAPDELRDPYEKFFFSELKPGHCVPISLLLSDSYFFRSFSAEKRLVTLFVPVQFLSPGACCCE